MPAVSMQTLVAPKVIIKKKKRFSPVSSTNKTDRNDVIEILLKKWHLNTKNQTKPIKKIVCLK
jgi:hypothetical protein